MIIGNFFSLNLDVRHLILDDKGNCRLITDNEQILPLVFSLPPGFARGAKPTVSAAVSVGASASQRCPPDTRTLVRWRQGFVRAYNKIKAISFSITVV